MSQFELSTVLDNDPVFNDNMRRLCHRNRQGKISDRIWGHIRARLVYFALRRFQRGESQVTA
jgi:hypothetical protein